MPESNEGEGYALTLPHVALILSVLSGLYGIGQGVWSAAQRDSALTQVSIRIEEDRKRDEEHFNRLEADLASRRQEFRQRQEADEAKIDGAGRTAAEINLHMAHLDSSVDQLRASVDLLLKTLAAAQLPAARR